MAPYDLLLFFQKLAWMDNSGTKCQTSFQEEETKKKIEELQHQIELRLAEA